MSKLSVYEIEFEPEKNKEQRVLWNTKSAKFNYPRPQGKLPASQWLYNIEYVPRVYYDSIASPIVKRAN
jgi:hypothetical protein